MIKYENLNFNFLFSTLKLYFKSNFKIKKIYYIYSDNRFIKFLSTLEESVE